MPGEERAGGPWFLSSKPAVSSALGAAKHLPGTYLPTRNFFNRSEHGGGGEWALNICNQCKHKILPFVSLTVLWATQRHARNIAVVVPNGGTDTLKTGLHLYDVLNKSIERFS